MTVLRLRDHDLFLREFDEEIVALDASDSRYFSANKTAAVLLKRLQESATRADLVDALCAGFRVPREKAEADVTAFIEDLAGRGLLEQSG